MKVVHKSDCKRVFKRYDMTCPRCQELSGGAEARSGWNDLKLRQAELDREAIRTHDFTACARRNGGVCTHFEW